MPSRELSARGIFCPRVPRPARSAGRLLIWAALLLLTQAPAMANKIPLSHDLKAGPHAVGFRVVHRFDTSREFKRAYQADGSPTVGERARPMQIGIWYPCQKPESGEPMLYEEYLKAAPFDLQPPGKSPRPVEDVLNWLGMSPTHEGVKLTLSTRTAAFWEATPAEGKLPVVIYASSNEAPLFENSVLCEYLASHGFILVGSPCIGARSRETNPISYADVHGQAADIEYLLGMTREIPQANAKGAAVVGFSIGAMANFVAALRSDRVVALVSLDGTLPSYFSAVRTQQYLEGIRTLEVPVLFATSFKALLPGGREDEDAFLQEIPFMEAWWIHCHRMSHQNFSSLFNHLWKRESDEQNPNTPRALKDYEAVCRYVHQFLGAQLLSDSEARRFLAGTVRDNELDPEGLEVVHRPARPSPATLSGFARRVWESGYGRILESYQAIREKDPQFDLAEADLRRWGFQLLSRNQTGEAVAVFQFNLLLHPRSNGSYNGLGEVYQRIGDPERARESFRRTIELNSTNAEARHAQRRLSELAAEAR